MEARSVLRVPSPRNAGNVVRLAERAVDRQHHVADFAAERRGTIDRRLAQRAAKLHAVERFVVVGRRDALREQRNHQPPRALNHLVVGAHLSRHQQKRIQRHAGLGDQLARKRDRQTIHRAGQALYQQRSRVKRLVHHFMRQLRRALQSPARRHTVVGIFHRITSYPDVSRVQVHHMKVSPALCPHASLTVNFLFQFYFRRGSPGRISRSAESARPSEALRH